MQKKTADGSVIRVAKTIDSIYGIFLFVIPSILIIMIGVFIVCTILAKRSTKKIVEPIKEMADNGNGSPYDELFAAITENCKPAKTNQASDAQTAV